MIFNINVYDSKTLWLLPVDTFPPSVYETLSYLPESRWRKNGGVGGFAAPATRLNIDYIYSHFKEGVDFSVGDQAKLLITYERLTNRVDDIKSAKRWEYLFHGQETQFNYPSVIPDRKPYMHQRVTVEAMYGSECFGLLMDMGTGKTRCVIDEIMLHSLKLAYNEVFKILIVVPSSLIMNWYRELFMYLPEIIDMKVETLDKGDAKSLDSIAALMRDEARVKVAIVSYDSLQTQKLQLKMFAANYVACDESHMLKNPSTKRWKATFEVAQTCGMKRILTGTVTCNNILDVWAQFEILRPGALGYQTFSAFKHHYANIIPVNPSAGQDFEKIVDFKNVEELKENMAKMSFTVKKKDCLDLPEKLYSTIDIEMTPELQKCYKEMVDNFCMDMGSDIEIKAEFILPQMLKLSQLCCGHMTGREYYGDELIDAETGLPYRDFERVTLKVPGVNTKLEMMLDDAETACAEGKLIIWNRFKLCGREIYDGLRQRGIACGVYDSGTDKAERQRIVDSFNNDSAFKVFIGNPGAGGTGLTLLGTSDAPTRNVFYYSNDFSYNKRVQSEDRCHRIGLKNSVSYRDYVYRASIEEFIADVLAQKKDVADCIKNVGSLKDLLLNGFKK